MSNKKKVFVWAGVIGILGVGYNAYHWFDGLTQNRIGYLYAEGIIGKKYGEKAFEWFQRSAEKGNSKGCLNLGHYYLCGHCHENRGIIERNNMLISNAALYQHVIEI